VPSITKQEAEDCDFLVARSEPIQFLLVGNVDRRYSNNLSTEDNVGREKKKKIKKKKKESIQDVMSSISPADL
jgi:hypothetical protein